MTRIPALVTEVTSASNYANEMRRKVQDYLSAGVRLIWVIYPDLGRADVYRLDGTSATVGPGGALDGEDVLPGFRLPLTQILPPEPSMDDRRTPGD
jgi:Uma2 family endonuclease